MDALPKWMPKTKRKVEDEEDTPELAVIQDAKMRLIETHINTMELIRELQRLRADPVEMQAERWNAACEREENTDVRRRIEDLKHETAVVKRQTAAMNRENIDVKRQIECKRHRIWLLQTLFEHRESAVSEVACAGGMCR